MTNTSFKARIDEVELESKLSCFGVVPARSKQLDILNFGSFLIKL